MPSADEIYVWLLEAIAADSVQDQIHEARKLRKECKRIGLHNKMLDLTERILVSHQVAVIGRLKIIETFQRDGDLEAVRQFKNELFLDVLTDISEFCTDERCQKLAENALLACEI